MGNDATGIPGGLLISPLEKIVVIWGNITSKSRFPVKHFFPSSVTCHTVIPKCHLDAENDFSEGVISLKQQKPPPSEIHPQRCARPGQSYHVRT